MKKNKFLVLAMFLSLIGLSNSAYAIPIAVTDYTGQLLGIDGISLYNDTYHVRFVDGEFDRIFGIGHAYDFVSLGDALEATNQLLIAYNTIIDPRYTDNASFTNGITDWQIGQILTPVYRPTYNDRQNAIYNNVSAGLGLQDFISTNTIHLGYVPQDGGVTYANWSVVPVPAAVWFMGSGLLGLMGFSRKRSQVAA